MVSLAVGGLLWLERHHPRPVHPAPSPARCISLRRLFLRGIEANARHVRRKGRVDHLTSQSRPRVPYELTPTNIPGAYVSPAIPEDFDPDAASPTALIKHGLLWRRPAADARPAHRAVWERAFSRQCGPMTA